MFSATPQHMPAARLNLQMCSHLSQYPEHMWKCCLRGDEAVLESLRNVEVLLIFHHWKTQAEWNLSCRRDLSPVTMSSWWKEIFNCYCNGNNFPWQTDTLFGFRYSVVSHQGIFNCAIISTYLNDSSEWSRNWKYWCKNIFESLVCNLLL